MSKRKAISNSPFNDIQRSNKKIKTDDNNNLFASQIANSEMKIPLQYLPDLVLEAIFRNLTYHDLAAFRILCKRFDVLGRWLLNEGFRLFHLKFSNIIQGVDHLATTPWKNILNYLYEIYFRLSMLDLAFYSHIMEDRCCFFPGKVLDLIKDAYVFMVDQVDKPDIKLILWHRFLDIKRVYRMTVEHAVEIVFPALNISVEQTSDVPSTSSRLLFDHKVFSENFIVLEFWYFKDPEEMIKLNVKDSPEFVNRINLFKMIEIKDDNPRLVHLRGLIAERVIGELLRRT